MLFQRAWTERRDSAESSWESLVGGFDVTILNDSRSFLSKLETLTYGVLPPVPQMQLEGIHGQRKDGRVIVHFPYDGVGDWFNFATSNGPVGLQADVGAHELIITLLDDEHVQRNVDIFLDQLRAALELLTLEVEQHRVFLMELGQRFREVRLADIENQISRDATVRFPIR